MIDRQKLCQQIMKATYWNTVETAEKREAVERSIDIARCQLPISKVHDSNAIFHRACLLLRIGGAQFYPVWC